MTRHRHRTRLPRPVLDAQPRQDWRIGPAPQREAVGTSTRIDLDHPIVVDGVTHRFITVRAPTSEDIRRIRREHHSKLTRGIALVVLLTGLSRAAVLKLDDRDTQKVDDLLIEIMV